MISKHFIRVKGTKKVFIQYNISIVAICVVLPVELDKITSESSHSWVWMLQLFFSPSLKSLIDGCKNERRNPPLKSSINLSNKSGSRHLQWIQVTLLLMLVVLSCHKLLISSIKLFNICNKSRVYNIWRDLSQDDDHIWCGGDLQKNLM